jgi:hypothetical protein
LQIKRYLVSALYLILNWHHIFLCLYLHLSEMSQVENCWVIAHHLGYRLRKFRLPKSRLFYISLNCRKWMHESLLIKILMRYASVPLSIISAIWGQTGLHSEFLTSLSYRARPCLKKMQINFIWWRCLLTSFGSISKFNSVFLMAYTRVVLNSPLF